MSSQIDVAVFAGLFMGEGTIYITPHKQTPYKGKTYFGLIPTIGVTNTDIDIINLCKSFLDPYHFSETVNPAAIRRKKSWYLRVNRQLEIVELLTKIRPFLIGDKAKAADLMVEFCSRYNAGKRNYNGRDLEIYLQIREINGRGERGSKIFNEFMQFIKTRVPRTSFKGKEHPMYGIYRQRDYHGRYLPIVEMKR